MLFELLRHPDDLLGQKRVLLLRLRLVKRVFADLVLQKLPHLVQLGLRLRRETFDKVLKLVGLGLAPPQLCSQVVPELLFAFELGLELDHALVHEGTGLQLGVTIVP